MATITKPMALDESFNTTESTSRNQADVLAGIEQAIRQGFGRSAADVSYDNTTSGLTADDVQEAIDELAAEKVDKVDGKGLSSNDFTDEDKAALDNMELDIESTQTVSGNPITLTDCAPINAESLVVELEPKQDLHGYDYPWVGGAGKNKWNFDGYLTVCKANNPLLSWTESDGVYAINSLGNLYETKYSFANTDAQVTLSVDIKLHSSGETETVWIILLDSQNNEVNSTTATLSTDYTHLTVSGVASKVWITYQYGRAVDIKCPQIESGSSATSFAPWQNICPITGYDECKVDDVGKNLFGSEIEEGVIGNDDGQPAYVADRYRTKNYISVLPSTHYIFGINGTAQKENWFEYDKDYNFIGKVGYVNNFTTNAQTRYVKCYGTNELLNNSTLQLEYGTTATSYEPYHSSNATIQFGQTVYGGSVDFLTGVLTVTYGEVDLGSLNWGYENSISQFYAGLPNIITDGYNNTIKAPMVCTNYPTYAYYTNGYFEGHEIGIAFGFESGNLLYVKDSTYSDAATFKTAMQGVKLVYELAVPFTIQLTPQELKLLQGTNNITTNGTKINLGYQPDNVIGEVKGEIEKCAVDVEFMQFSDGTDTFTDVNLSLDASFHAVSVVGSKIEQKRFICLEVMDKRGGVLQGILASCIAFTDGAKTPSGTAFRAYIESLQMYVNFRIYGSAGSYTLAYQSETSFSASAFYVRVRMMNNL